jgi:hypothetical protein
MNKYATVYKAAMSKVAAEQYGVAKELTDLVDRNNDRFTIDHTPVGPKDRVVDANLTATSGAAKEVRNRPNYRTTTAREYIRQGGGILPAIDNIQRFGQKLNHKLYNGIFNNKYTGKIPVVNKVPVVTDTLVQAGRLPFQGARAIGKFIGSHIADKLDIRSQYPNGTMK